MAGPPVVRYGRNPDWDLLLERGDARASAFAELLGAGTTIEHKSEQRAIDFGTVFVECGDDGQGDTGLTISQADWHAIEYAPQRWLVLKTDELHRIAVGCVSQHGLTWGGWQGRSLGVKVPLVRLVQQP